MAKSKKALKALKRRKEAKKRSRVVQERQDYREGGRVKANTGGLENLSATDFWKRGDKLFVKNKLVTSDDANYQGYVDRYNQVEAERVAAQQERQRVAAEQARQRQEQEQQKAAAATTTEPAATTEQPAETTTTEQPAATAEPEEQRTETAAEAATTTQYGDADTVDPRFADTPFDFSGLDVPEDSRVITPRINAGDGSDSYRVAIPWAAMTQKQRDGLQFIADNYPNQSQELDRAKAAYNFLKEEFGLRGPVVEEDEEDLVDDITIAPAVDYEEHIASIMEKRGLTREEAIANQQNAFKATEDFADYNKDGVITGAEWTEWRKLADTDGDNKLTAEEHAAAVRQMKGLRKDPAPEGAVGDPASKLLDEVYDKTKRQAFKVDDPEAFEVATTPRAGTEIDEAKELGEVTSIGQQDVETSDIAVTEGDVTEAEAQLPIEPSTMEAYSQAEANYLDKYPEAAEAISQGRYSNVFDYHAKEGEEKGNTLDFDTTKIAQSDFTTLANASRAQLTQTQAALRDADAEQEALADRPVFTQDMRSMVDPVTGETIQLAPTADAEKQQRKAITDEEPAQGTEAIIQGQVGYEAAQRRQLKGEAANGDAVTLLQEVGEIPPDISEAILDDPVVVTAQVDTQPVEVQAAIAALPNEALVSVQLESLLAGIDEGKTPTWARPAVQLVESNLAARGLSVSTVGRDALFNAIIQSAIPLAQSNATALQQRATQNLSNEQQANLQQASQEMQLRMANLANRQQAGFQTAQLAQQVNLTQGQFTQQARLTEAEQRQQVRISSLQNEQQAAMVNLGNDQQMEMANLQVEAERLGANQNAVNQERLAEMQVAANFLEKNAAFKQQMELANISNEQQMRLAFLTAKNQAESENLSAAQQTELANLNKRLEVNKRNAELAQQMGLAQLNVDQQRAMQNASTVANIDMAKFNSEQQIELANSKFMQTVTMQDLSNRQQAVIQDATALASMDLQEADNLTKVSIENARNFLQRDLANLNVTQQAYVLDAQQRQQRLLTAVASENAARQFNAANQTQIDQFMANLGQQLNLQNAASQNAMEQFNTAETNRLAAVEAGNDLEASKIEAQINAQIDQYNSQLDFQRDQWNTANAQAVEQSNVNWRRQANMAETAARNAANQLQAQQQFSLSQQEQAFLWQQLRDEATYFRQQYESEQQRKTTLYATALANETEHSVKNVSSTFNLIAGLFNSMGTSNVDLGGRAR